MEERAKNHQTIQVKYWRKEVEKPSVQSASRGMRKNAFSPSISRKASKNFRMTIYEVMIDIDPIAKTYPNKVKKIL